MHRFKTRPASLLIATLISFVLAFSGCGGTGNNNAGQPGSPTPAPPPPSLVFFTGGKIGGANLASTAKTEMYNAETDRFVDGPDMKVPRAMHSSTFFKQGPLAGKVLVAGGEDSTNHAVDSTEIFDTVNPGFSDGNKMTTPREAHTATLLQDGKVLIAGGIGANGQFLNTAEIFNPSTGQFTATAGPMVTVHQSHTATLLNNGKVLIAGGNSLGTAELFDPGTGTFTNIAPLSGGARISHTATLLSNGRVLIVGGKTGPRGSLNTAEIFDPDTNSFTATPQQMHVAREGHSATQYFPQGGIVLIAGGRTAPGQGTDTAETFNPVDNTFTLLPGRMTTLRANQTATLIHGGPNDGKILLMGGVVRGTAVFGEAELYDIRMSTFAATALPPTAGVVFHSAVDIH